MYIEMFNFWYFFWMFIQAGATALLYFLLRKARPFTQSAVLFSLLIVGLVLHFLKIYVAPYGEMVNGEWEITSRGLRDSWFVNICGANILLFPIFYFSKNKYIKDYMFYIGVISGLIVFFYPQEPIAKGDAASQMAEIWDILRFYYHHWMIMTVPLLTVLLKKHKLSWKRVWIAPVGLLALMLFIILNQVFQAELGFIPLRNDALIPNFKNTSYIWGPLNQDGTMDPIGAVFDIFCPSVFKKLPISCEGYGYAVGAVKYWPWFWLIVPCFILVTPLAFGISLIFEWKSFKADATDFVRRVRSGELRREIRAFGRRIYAAITQENPSKKSSSLKADGIVVEIDNEAQSEN